MAAFLLIQLQNICQTRENVIRDLNISTLFEPGVPGRAHTGQLRNFFTPQAGCSPPIGRGQADVGGCDASAPVAEKIAQFLPSDFVLGHIAIYKLGLPFNAEI